MFIELYLPVRGLINPCGLFLFIHAKIINVSMPTSIVAFICIYRIIARDLKAGMSFCTLLNEKF